MIKSLISGETTRLIRWGIMSSILLVQFGSVSHLAYTFSQVEGREYSPVGWVIALGVEIALSFTALGHKELQKRRDKSQQTRLRKYLFGFSFINLYGNYYYGIIKMGVFANSISNWIPVEQLNHFTVFVLSASLPLISLALIEVYEVVSRKEEKEIAAKQPKQPRSKKEKPTVCKIEKVQEKQESIFNPALFEAMPVKKNG